MASGLHYDPDIQLDFSTLKKFVAAAKNKKTKFLKWDKAWRFRGMVLGTGRVQYAPTGTKAISW
jgi:hypothetical protein